MVQRRTAVTLAAFVAVLTSASLPGVPPAGAAGAPRHLLRPPAVPAHGAYLGAWVNPEKEPAGEAPASQELRQLPAFRRNVGRDVAILHVYAPFRAPAPVSSLARVTAAGAIPLLDWSCAPPSAVVSGSLDPTITAYADALRSFGHPVLLRWFWEMNLPRTHPRCPLEGRRGAAAFVAAWRHIHQLFAEAGASNVAFVWCPGISAGVPGMAQYYPGDRYVDWIAVDGYDRRRQGSTAFDAIFSKWYATWSHHGKPMMIAETGALQGSQAAYLDGVRSALPARFAHVKAFVYFDAPGPNGHWELDAAGHAAFASLASDPYFSARG